MSESLWSATVDELLAKTASAEPTPGGGSVAAVCGALGVGLMQMALAVTDDEALEPEAIRLAGLRDTIAPVADADVRDFGVLMTAFRMPRSDEAEKTARAERIERASIAATETPLALADALVAAVDLSREVEGRVKPGIRSDVLAGRDLTVGAARAAIRTADINIAQLERLGSAAAAELRSRRDALAARLEEAR